MIQADPHADQPLRRCRGGSAGAVYAVDRSIARAADANKPGRARLLVRFNSGQGRQHSRDAPSIGEAPCRLFASPHRSGCRARPNVREVLISPELAVRQERSSGTDIKTAPNPAATFPKAQNRRPLRPAARVILRQDSSARLCRSNERNLQISGPRRLVRRGNPRS